MMSELTIECHKVGLEANSGKTKLMTNGPNLPIKINSVELEYVDNYIYLGQAITFKNNNYEINRRITNAWKNAWSLK